MKPTEPSLQKMQTTPESNVQKMHIPAEWVEKAKDAYAQAVAQTEREPIQAALAAVIPLIRDADDKIARSMLRLSEEKTAALTAERDRYREALEKIAGCETHHPGDVVSIARQALEGDT